MTPINLFNARMAANNRRFRLVHVSTVAPVGAPSAASYELRRLNTPGDTGFTLCYRIADVPEEVAVQLADAFVSGADWARQGMRSAEADQGTFAL